MLLILIATILTLAFAALAWLGLGVYQIWMPAEFGKDLSLLARVALGVGLPFPWHAIAWQAVAVLSLAWVLAGAGRSRDVSTWPLERRLLVHLAGIVAMLLSLGVAMIAPLVDIAAVIR